MVPGNYTVSGVEEVPQATAEEEAGIEAALVSLRRGEGLPAKTVYAKMRVRVRRRLVATR